MAVQPASLEILEKADVPPAQARAIVQAIEIEIAGAKETLATRGDVLLVKQDVVILRQEMAQLRTELGHEMANLRTELRHEMQDMATGLRQEMAELRHGLELRLASMVTQRQLYGTVFGAILGQMTLLLGIAYFFVTHLQR